MQRTGKELLIASKIYAVEDRAKSWWYFWSTLVLMIFMLAVAGHPSVPLVSSVCASVVAGLVIVRMFVIYHDFFHGAILRNSWLAFSILYVFGLVILSPATSWKSAHDHHHKHNSNEFGAEIGGFPIMTTESYWASSEWGRFGYRCVRNPLIILFGYVTSFLVSKTLVNFATDPKNNLACGASLIVHFSLMILLGMYSIKALMLVMLLPMFIGCGFGTYLFYVQHNFPGMKRKEGNEWDYVYAAMHSSSFLDTSPMMNWFTGNIGFHHVHHLNSKIPFYRLPEAMDELVELQAPVQTSLRLKDIVRCLRLKLWDPKSESLLTFQEANQLALATGVEMGSTQDAEKATVPTRS